MTVTVVVASEPLEHPDSLGVTVKVTVIAALELLVSAPVMVPVNDWFERGTYAEPPVAPGLVELTATSYLRFAGIEGTVVEVIVRFTLLPSQIVAVVLLILACGIGSTVTITCIVDPEHNNVPGAVPVHGVMS